jgi:hypothetical protein
MTVHPMSTPSRVEFDRMLEAHGKRWQAARRARCVAFLELGAPSLSDVDTSKPVWVQIAAAGDYKGYEGGAFKFDRGVFDTIVANFRAHPAYAAGTRDVIPWDFHHASEFSPASGSIPVDGVPAQGWVRELEVRRGAKGVELWALTRWLEPARSYIKEGKYKWASVTVYFGVKDPVTGEERGANLVSVALTNQPFIEGMQELVAASRDVKLDATITTPTSFGRAPRVHSPTALPEGQSLADPFGAAFAWLLDRDRGWQVVGKRLAGAELVECAQQMAAKMTAPGGGGWEAAVALAQQFGIDDSLTERAALSASEPAHAVNATLRGPLGSIPVTVKTRTVGSPTTVHATTPARTESQAPVTAEGARRLAKFRNWLRNEELAAPERLSFEARVAMARVADAADPAGRKRIARELAALDAAGSRLVRLTPGGAAVEAPAADASVAAIIEWLDAHAPIRNETFAQKHERALRVRVAIGKLAGLDGAEPPLLASAWPGENRTQQVICALQHKNPGRRMNLETLRAASSLGHSNAI